MKLMKKDIRPNQHVTSFFALESMQLKKARSGKDYLVLSLYDRTGRINGFLWNDPEETAATLKEKTIVKVRGIATERDGSLIVNIERVRTAGTEESDIGDFLDVVPGGISLWNQKLLKVTGTVQDAGCNRLIKAFLDDDRFMELFITSPGGILIHHNYVGGLLEHTTNSMELVSLVADRHSALLNKDLCVTGTFLHDIGKTREIYWEIARDHTTEGKLLGHITLGIMMLEEKLATLKGFPAELANRLRHMIISHHGNLEYGSPVRPATPEALVLHLLEAADAKINHLYCHLGNCEPEKEWSHYDRILETAIYQKKYTNKVNKIEDIAA